MFKLQAQNLDKQLRNNMEGKEQAERTITPKQGEELNVLLTLVKALMESALSPNAFPDQLFKRMLVRPMLANICEELKKIFPQSQELKDLRLPKPPPETA